MNNFKKILDLLKKEESFLFFVIAGMGKGFGQKRKTTR